MERVCWVDHAMIDPSPSRLSGGSQVAVENVKKRGAAMAINGRAGARRTSQPKEVVVGRAICLDSDGLAR